MLLPFTLLLINIVGSIPTRLSTEPNLSLFPRTVLNNDDTDFNNVDFPTVSAPKVAPNPVVALPVNPPA